MHRALLLDLLEAYAARHPEERITVDRTRAFVRAHPDCFLRSCRDGHVTGSAWIVSADHRRVLLTHHRKLGRWLQLGGHADGDPDPLRVARREAEEESGLTRLVVHPAAGTPLDLDVHSIPAHGDEPSHDHHDVRYLFVAEDDATVRVSDESHALRWVERDRLVALVNDESLVRLERKARRLLP